MKLKVEQWPIERLKNYPKNARTHSDVQVAQIAVSIGAFGFVNPVLVDKAGTLIAGHGRLAGARQAGLSTVPVIQLGHLTEDQARALRLADNRIQMSGAWDADMLRFELNELQLAQFDMPLLGFENYELADFMAAPVPEGADPEQTPEPPANPVTRLGDLWVLGKKHRLLCGDSTKAEDVARVMDGRKAQLCFTDPPYGVAYKGGMKVREKLANDQIGTGIYAAALRHLQIALDDKAALYLWYADANAAAAAAAAAGYEIVAQVIWAKNHAQFMTSAHYKGKHEPCFYAHRRGKSARWHGPNNEVTLWECNRAPRNDYHPTQKPVALAERAIRNSSLPGQLVLDLFMGGGTTIIACEAQKRVACGIELNPAFADVCVLRYQEFAKQHATLANDGRTFDEITKARGQTNGQAGAQVRAARGRNGLRPDGVDASPDARRNPTRKIQHPHGGTKPVRMRKGATGPGQKAQRASLTRQKQKADLPEPPQA